MRKVLLLLAVLLALALLSGTVKVAAQEISPITVKGYELNNRVVILDIAIEDKSYELQCNQGMSRCEPLKNGKYLLVELPKNYGIYDCRNVEVYPESAAGAEEDNKLGEYCLIVR